MTTTSEISPEDLRSVAEDALSLSDRDDAEALVPALPPQTFVRMARHLREEGRLELLLPHATPDQLTTLFDLDVWQRDQVDIGRSRAWLLEITRSYAASGRERGALDALVREMDPEMWTLALADGLIVATLEPGDDAVREQAFESLGPLEPYETPDGFFLVGVPETEVGRAAIEIIEAIYADSLATGRHLLLSILAALPSEIEEELHRYRTGRLADLGFVEWEAAMRLLRGLDVKAALAREGVMTPAMTSDLTLPDLPQWRGAPDLLRQVLDRLEPGELGTRSREFLLLANEIMAALRMDPADEALQERALAKAKATVSIGLELLATGAPAGTDALSFLAERVRVLGLRDVFRVGYGPLDRVRQAALALHREGRVSLRSVGSLLDRPLGPALTALSRMIPELPLADAADKARPLRSMADVRRATELLGQASALAMLCFSPRGFGIDPVWITRADDPDRLRLGDLVRTAMIWAQRPGATQRLVPLDRTDVAWAAEHLLQDGQVLADLRLDLEARLRDLEASDHAAALAELLLVRLGVELGALERAPDGLPDLTRVGGLFTIQQVGVWLRTTLPEPAPVTP